MNKSCSVCWAWQPTHWEVSKWVDEAAKCLVKKRFVTKGESCESFSIVRQRVVLGDDFIGTELKSETEILQPQGKTIQWASNEDQPIRTIEEICLQPNTLGDKLYRYQIDAIRRFKDETEIALFLEMGCGKSAITLRIAVWKFLHSNINTLLVVAPNDVHSEWAIEHIAVWLPPEVRREVQCYGGQGGSKTTHIFIDNEALHILCVNIDTFSTPSKWREIAEWAKATKCMVVLDEATCIKNKDAKRTQRILYEFNEVIKRGQAVVSSTIKTVARAVLTGTPITNGIIDVWSLAEFLRPNYFGRNWYSFRSRYSMLTSINTAYGSAQVLVREDTWKGIKNCSTVEMAMNIFGCSAETYEIIQAQNEYSGPYKHVDEVKELLAPISLFLTLTDVVDMPPQVYVTRKVCMSQEQQKAYKDMRKELLSQYGGATTTASNKVASFIRMSQISSGFIVHSAQLCAEEDYIKGEYDGYDIKPGEVRWLGSTIPKLESLYRDIEESTKPVIIITRFSAEASRIYTDLNRTSKVLLYTGWKKTGTIEEFKDGKYEILVANIRCISRGFNLQNACKMFFYSNTFSLEDRLQTEGRIFRIGQSNTCVYTDYVNEDTIDHDIIDALRQKRSLLDYIRNNNLEEIL